MALILDLADAVTSALNTADPGTFSQDFTAARRVDPTVSREESKELLVTVAPHRIVIAAGTRGLRQHSYYIYVGIRQQVSSPNDLACDQLATLSEEICDYLRDIPRLAGRDEALVTIENDPPYATQPLDMAHLFVSVITLQYRILR